MAITAADLQVKLSTSGADKVKSDLASVGAAVDSTGRKGATMGTTLATAFRWGVIGAATGVIAGAAAGITQWVMGASNLAEAQSKVNVVYGQSANVINKWAKTTAKAFGITETQALDTAGTMGNLFTNMGFTQDQAAGMSTELVELSADMASFNNVSQPQVIEALTSAFVGEYDALQRLGVPINAAAVEQYALNNGIWDGVDAMTDAERATAVYGLTMENTTNAQGDVARTSGEMANQLRFLSAGFSELGTRIGTVFLPAANAMVGWAIDAVDWMSRLGDTFTAGGFGAALDSVIGDLASLGSQVIDVAITIGSFLWDSAVDIGADLVQWIKDNGLSTAQDLGNIAVSIGAIIWETSADIFSGLALWLRGNIGDIAQDIGNIAVSVGGIIWETGADIFSGLALWLQGNISGIAQDIGNVTVSVGAIIWQAGADIFGGFVTWISQAIGLQDFTPVGDTASTKIMSALSLAFSAGQGVGGATGGVFNIGAGILAWINRQIESQLGEGGGFASIGERIGSALAAAVAAAIGGGAGVVGLQAVGQSFASGILTAVGAEIEDSGFGNQFWALFDNLGEAGGQTFEGIAEGFINSFVNAIAPGGTLTLPGGFTISLPNIEFSGSLATAFKRAFLESAMPSSQMDLEKLTVSVSNYDWGAGLGDAFKESFINAVIPGGSLTIDALDIGVPDIDWPDPMDLVPQDIKDFLSDPWGYVKSHLGGGGSGAGGGDGTEGGTGSGDTGFGGGGWGLNRPFAGGLDLEPIIADFGRVTVAANAARDAIGGVFSGGAGGEGGRGAVGAGAGAGITSTITSVIASLTQLQSAAQVARAAMASMTAAVTAGMASIRSAFTAGMAAAVAAVTAGMASARAATAAGAASMASSMVAGMAVFRAAVTSGMAAAVAAVRAGIAAMVAAASAGRGQMMSAGLGIGAALGQGIAAGIRGQIGAVAAAAAALVSAAVSAAKSAGAISSPSRVMQEQVGQMLGLGAIVGVQDMYPGMNAAMAGLVQTPTVPLVAGGGLNSGISGGSGGITVTVIVQGSVTTERELTGNITRVVGTAIRDDLIRHRVAAGVAP